MATLHFLFSDIEGSTRLWDEYPESMGAALQAHDRAMHQAVESCGGRVFKHTGDGFACVFESAHDAVCAAVEAQHSLASIGIGEGHLKARMAVHSGPAEERDDDYFGPTLNRVARLMSAGHGGQVLCSLVTRELAIDSLGEDLDLVSLGSHRLRDLTRAEEIFQLVGGGLDSDFPPIRTPDVVPNNLPVALTPFVGREEESRRAADLLNGSRLLTITGVGGAGKTRLALQVGAALTDSTKDGVWLVELAALTDGARVIPTIADTLGVEEAAGTALLDSIVERLDRKDALLVLDNCEHLLDACAEAAETLLARLPSLRVIATSREVLNVPGETTFGLRSMSLPSSAASLDDLDNYDAIQLFVDRALAASPTFHLDSMSAQAVVEVCRRLDGMPLAIELAAARLRSLSVQQVAENLDKRFRLLTGGSRTALPRQQTLAAAIDWSFRLLNDQEKLVFERLSVFQGGFNLEAAQAVCSGDGIDEFEVMDLVSSLVDKSLVVAETGDTTARYHFLETIRQFARDRLDDRGSGESFREKHAEYFTEFAERLNSLFGGGEEATALASAEADLDNLRHGMDWALMTDRPEIAMRTATALNPFWVRNVRHVEGADWLERSIEARHAQVDSLQAKALISAGQLLSLSNPTAGFPLYEEGLTIARQHSQDDDEAKRILIRGLINIGNDLDEVRRFEEAESSNREARELARGFDLRSYSVATGNVADHTANRGDLETASELFEESVATADELGVPSRRFDARWQAANFQRANMSNPSRAEQLYGEAVEIGRSTDQHVWANLLDAHRAATRLELNRDGAFDEFLTAAGECLAVPDFRAYGAQVTLLVFRGEFDARRGDFMRVAKVLGAIEGMAADGNIIMNYHDKVISELTQETKETLGESAYEAERVVGMRMSHDERLELVTQNQALPDSSEPAP